jgi:hypothetical protein
MEDGYLYLYEDVLDSCWEWNARSDEYWDFSKVEFALVLIEWWKMQLFLGEFENILKSCIDACEWELLDWICVISGSNYI